MRHKKTPDAQNVNRNTLPGGKYQLKLMLSKTTARKFLQVIALMLPVVAL
jgi:hypothetical protein